MPIQLLCHALLSLMHPVTEIENKSMHSYQTEKYSRSIKAIATNQLAMPLVQIHNLYEIHMNLYLKAIYCIHNQYNVNKINEATLTDTYSY